jgi:hypothetical protein
MAEFLVLKVSSGTVPALGQKGSADVYRGDHADGQAARVAAAVAFGLAAGVPLWSVAVADLTSGTTSVSCS